MGGLRPLLAGMPRLGCPRRTCMTTGRNIGTSRLTTSEPLAPRELVSVREGLESSESLVILSWAPIREVPDVVCEEPRPL